jgi:hydroxymethylglutaryl-CoA lyase
MSIKIIECPRDAMQGIHQFIPTQTKINYISQLLKVGFDTIDFGSFVSPKAIPQMADTSEVLAGLDLTQSKSKLLAIIANLKGAEMAVKYPEISYLGFPFSISETFQHRNTNSSILESLKTVVSIQELCLKNNKKLVIYISMGFGNPYGDEWNTEIVEKWVNEMSTIGIEIVSLSDTIGIATPQSISYLFNHLIPVFPKIEFGAHLHTTPNTWKEKIDAAFLNGCKRFDGALKGFGGCPMASDSLTGNMPTENLFDYFKEKKEITNIDDTNFINALHLANQVFENIS